jgi:chromosome segregation ATPase
MDAGDELTCLTRREVTAMIAAGSDPLPLALTYATAGGPLGPAEPRLVTVEERELERLRSEIARLNAVIEHDADWSREIARDAHGFPRTQEEWDALAGYTRRLRALAEHRSRKTTTLRARLSQVEGEVARLRGEAEYWYSHFENMARAFSNVQAQNNGRTREIEILQAQRDEYARKAALWDRHHEHAEQEKRELDRITATMLEEAHDGR